MTEPDHLIWIKDWCKMHSLNYYTARRALKRHGIALQKFDFSRRSYIWASDNARFVAALKGGVGRGSGRGQEPAPSETR